MSNCVLHVQFCQQPQRIIEVNYRGGAKSASRNPSLIVSTGQGALPVAVNLLSGTRLSESKR